jgi:GNAT superfamily N-acetyltransferase
MSIEFKYISPEETRPLRQLVLRQGKPIESCIWNGDHLQSTKHIGAFLSSRCIGVLSLFNNLTEKVEDKSQYQLRGMAVHPEHQGKGIGKALVAFSEAELKKSGIYSLWCNARTSAESFYENLDFTVSSEEFLIEDVGPHFIMSKTLT